ncbi:hypothetical protein [Streptomyces sp. NBC_00503]|nr:hypothetical protein [Streptomyces sp. NBC_00503]WUD85417.1 hypothetical protein OG490_35360 [Streptomyces sp. NBC_00503]
MKSTDPLPDTRTENGNRLQIWDCHDINAQHWNAPGLASPLAATG